MKNGLLFAILFAGCTQQSFAQTDSTEAPKVKGEKRIDHYIGVQLNPLIRQVFNFNNAANAAIVNPYLVTYNINLRKSGWGLRVGAGYNYNSGSNDDGITKTTFKINDMHARFGIEKAFTLTTKWSAGIGLDVVYNSNDDNTTNLVRSFDTTTTATKSKLSSMGGGAMGWLRYQLTPRVLIGTETSFYYTSGTDDQTIDITSKSFSGGGGGGVTKTTETKSKPTVTQGILSVPVAFYLIVKF